MGKVIDRVRAREIRRECQALERARIEAIVANFRNARAALCFAVAGAFAALVVLVWAATP